MLVFLFPKKRSIARFCASKRWDPLASAKNADGGACSPVGILKESWSESSLLLLLLVLGF